MNRNFFISIAIVLFGLLPLVSCTDDNSDLGIINEDALIDGTLCDSTTIEASTFRELNMNTSNYANGVLGIYKDATFGTTEASIYTQVALSTTGGISFENDVDSVVLSLSFSEVFSSDTSRKQFTAHFDVNPLTESLSIDSIYTANTTKSCSSTSYFSKNVKFSKEDTTINLKLDNSIHALFNSKTYQNNDEFINILKGLRIKMTPQSPCENNLMLYINYNAQATGLTVYYHDSHDSVLSYNFIFNERSTCSAAHFNNYTHSYTGSALSTFVGNENDSISGNGNISKLYLQPLGGTFVKLRFPYLKKWASEHPLIVIHQARLIIPIHTDILSTAPASRLLCYKYRTTDSVALIPDLTDAILSSGFNGYYDSAKKQYSLYITRQIQQLVSGSVKDYGLALYIDARRTTANSTILYGTAKTLARHMKLEIIYTETK